MDEAGKQRAADYVTERLAQKGWTPAHLARASGVHEDTVSAFLSCERWPWAAKRGAIEEALGVGLGTLERVARGRGQEVAQGDPVEIAILRSNLSRANQHRLIGTYYGMLEEQQERGSA